MSSQRFRRVGAAFALVGIAIVLTVAAAGTANAAPFRPAPGTVVVRDDMSGSSIVTFLVPAGTSIGRREIAAAVVAAGVSNDGIEEPPSQRRGVREIRLRTSLSTRTSPLSRRVNGRLFRDLDVFHEGRVVLSVHPWARVAGGEVRLLASDPLARHYAVSGDSDLTYAIPASAVLGVLVLILLLALVPFTGLRAYAKRLSRRDLDAADKLHRLQASLMAVGLILLLGVGAALFLGGPFALPDLLLGSLPPGVSRPLAVRVAAGMLLLLAVLLVPLLPARRAIAPYLRELRGVKATRASRIANLRAASVFGLGGAFGPLLFNLLSGTSLNPVVRVTLIGLGFLLLALVMPLLAIRLMPTRRLDEPLRRRLDALLGRSGVRVRAIRVLDTRSQKVATALLIGPAPFLRYVVVSDYLLERLEEDEVEAVVAHELGHARQHHLLIKLGVVLVLAGILVAAFGAGSRLFDGLGLLAPLLVIVVVLIVLAGIPGGVGLVLEPRADEYAARLVGVEPMIRALEKLAEVNLLKRRTGPLWNLLAQHPGIAQRVERLQRALGRTALDPAAPSGGA